MFVGLKLSYTQPVKFNKKTLKFLDSAKVIFVEFNFSDLTFESDKKSENIYLENRKTRLNKYKEGKGDHWIKNGYYNAKNQWWQEKFVNEFNKHLEKSNKKVRLTLNKENADHKMIIHTKWMYLGYDVGVFDEPAKIKLDINFFNINEPEKPLSNLFIKSAHGTNRNIDNDHEFPYLMRVGNAYRRSAFMLFLVLKRYIN